MSELQGSLPKPGLLLFESRIEPMIDGRPLLEVAVGSRGAN